MPNALWPSACKPCWQSLQQMERGCNSIVFVRQVPPLGLTRALRIAAWSRELMHTRHRADLPCFQWWETTVICWLPWKQVPRTQLLTSPGEPPEFLIYDLRTPEALLKKKCMCSEPKEKYVTRFDLALEDKRNTFYMAERGCLFCGDDGK